MNIDDCQVKIKLRRQTGHGLDFIYDPLTEEMKIFVRYTMITVNTDDTPMELNHLMNYTPENMITNEDMESVTSTGSAECLVGKIFFDSENNRSLKVVSIVNVSNVNVIECDYLTGTAIGEVFTFDYGKAKQLINVQLTN